MAQCVGSIVRLCWIVCWLLVLPSLVHCQFTGGGDVDGVNRFRGGKDRNGDGKVDFGGRFPGGRGGGRFGKGFGKGDGGRFGGGSNGADDGSTAASQAAQDPAAVSTPSAADATLSTIDIAAVTSAAVPASGDEPQAAAPPQAASSATPVPVSGETTSAQAIDPALIPTAAPAPASSTPVAALPVVASSAPAPVTSDVDAGSVDAAISTPVSATTVKASGTVTSTVEETVIVTPSPVPDSAPTSSPTPSSTLDLAPLSTNPGTTMSASARAGVGVGVTFGVLSVAGIAGLFLWRRRRNSRDISQDGGTGGFFMLNSRNSDRKDDPEWSVHSAEKIEIARGASVRSVRTGSRSDSKSSINGKGDGEGGGTEVLKVGMQLPEKPVAVERPVTARKNIALTSNPVVSPLQSPAKSQTAVVGNTQERKTSWPLPDN